MAEAPRTALSIAAVTAILTDASDAIASGAACSVSDQSATPIAGG